VSLGSDVEIVRWTVDHQDERTQLYWWTSIVHVLTPVWEKKIYIILVFIERPPVRCLEGVDPITSLAQSRMKDLFCDAGSAVSPAQLTVLPIGGAHPSSYCQKGLVPCGQPLRIPHALYTLVAFLGAPAVAQGHAGMQHGRPGQPSLDFIRVGSQRVGTQRGDGLGPSLLE
jgi:hypothetical protein